MIVSAYLVIGPIVAEPQIQYFYALCFILAGLIFYVPFVYYKNIVPGMGMHIQSHVKLSIYQTINSDSFVCVTQTPSQFFFRRFSKSPRQQVTKSPNRKAQQQFQNIKTIFFEIVVVLDDTQLVSIFFFFIITISNKAAIRLEAYLYIDSEY